MISTVQAQPLSSSDHQLALTVGGFTRHYILHVPTSDSADRMPLVMMLHGAGGNASGAARNYGWILKSDAEHFIVVFPQALPFDPTRPSNFLLNPNVWNDHRPDAAPRREIDDIAFLSAVIDDVQRQCHVDPNRIYITGFSNGASMTFTLATQLSKRIAAIAPVSGHCWPNDVALAHPVPLMLIVGDADPLNPLAGGLANNPWGPPTTKPAMVDSITDWLRFNNETSADVSTQSHGEVTTKTFAAQSACPIVFITIAGQGHEWPGHRSVLPKTLTGNNATTFDATTNIWNFLKDKSLKKGG